VGIHLEYSRRTDYKWLFSEQAIAHKIPVLNNLDIDNTIKRMLSLIKEICKTLIFKNSVDELEKLINIVIKKYGGRLVNVSYFLPGFGNH